MRSQTCSSVFPIISTTVRPSSVLLNILCVLLQYTHMLVLLKLYDQVYRGCVFHRFFLVRLEHLEECYRAYDRVSSRVQVPSLLAREKPDLRKSLGGRRCSI